MSLETSKPDQSGVSKSLNENSKKQGQRITTSKESRGLLTQSNGKYKNTNARPQSYESMPSTNTIKPILTQKSNPGTKKSSLSFQTPEKNADKVSPKKIGFTTPSYLLPERRFSLSTNDSVPRVSPPNDTDSFANSRRASAPPILPNASTVPVTYNGMPYMLVPASPQLPVQIPSPIGYYYSPPGRLSTDSTSPPRSICKFFLQGTCKYGDKCTYSHTSAPSVPILPIPIVLPQAAPLEAYNGLNLSREDCLVVIRLLAHLEEVNVQHGNAVVIQFEQDVNENGEEKTVLTPLTVTDVFSHIDNGCSTPTSTLLISLNELMGNEVIENMSACAHQIVKVIPEGTLDADTIVDSSKVCDNDALLFFAVLLKDIQEHFYISEFDNKYLQKGEDSYTYNTENVQKILQQIGSKEEDIYSKLDYDQTKKISQCCKRWRFLFLSNQPEAIVLDSNIPDSEKIKSEILKRLEDYVLSHIPNKPPEKRKSRHSKTTNKLPPFSVLFGNEPTCQSVRRKWWNDFRSSRSAEEICNELNNYVGVLKSQGFTNFPAVFNIISSKLKMSPNPGPKTLDEKLSSIADVLTKWPEVLLLPEILQRNDGKLRIYYSITQEHQLGAVYDELMTRLKKKYLYKSSLRELTEKSF
jgi:hypothetical protein